MRASGDTQTLEIEISGNPGIRVQALWRLQTGYLCFMGTVQPHSTR